MAIDMPYDNQQRENLLEIHKKLGKQEAENEYENALMFGGVDSKEIIAKGGGNSHAEISDDELKLFEPTPASVANQRSDNHGDSSQHQLLQDRRPQPDEITRTAKKDIFQKQVQFLAENDPKTSERRIALQLIDKMDHGVAAFSLNAI